WRSMSGMISIGDFVLWVPRNPAIATTVITAKMKIRKKERSMASVVDQRDVLAANLLEQFPCNRFRKLRIARFDDEKESVIRDLREPLPIEHRMIPAWQL